MCKKLETAIVCVSCGCVRPCQALLAFSSLSAKGKVCSSKHGPSAGVRRKASFFSVYGRNQQLCVHTSALSLKRFAKAIVICRWASQLVLSSFWNFAVKLYREIVGTSRTIASRAQLGKVAWCGKFSPCPLNTEISTTAIYGNYTKLIHARGELHISYNLAPWRDKLILSSKSPPHNNNAFFFLVK